MNKIKRVILTIFYMYVKRDTIALSKKIGVRMGNKCQVLDNPFKCFGTEPWLIKLGNHVDVTTGVRFLNHEGGIWVVRGIDPSYDLKDTFTPIVVGDNVLLGSNSLIMPGIKIGNNVIVAAHSVVTKDIPDNTIVGGNPAKPIGQIDAFIEKFKYKELFPTKKMNQNEKKEYLMNVHPEWFE